MYHQNQRRKCHVCESRVTRKKRQEQLDENVRKATREHEEAKKNSRFTQVSPKGWERVRELLTDKQGVAALRLYSFLAEHIDPSCGAVVADQQFLADKMGVNRSTIIRWLNYLESKTHWLGSLLQERSAHMH